MPQKLAAKKALVQAHKHHKRNISVKSTIKDTIKTFKKTVESKDANAIKAALTAVYATLDKAASKKIIHRNKASRKKSRLARFAAVKAA